MDGLPDVKTLRRMNHAAYRCAACGKLCQKQPAKCPGCGSREFEPASLRATDYCEEFGHNDTETLIPGSEQVTHDCGEMAGGKRKSIAIVSHKYLVSCLRCGRRRTRRKTEAPNVGKTT